ncbi:MAG: cytidine deaminase [Verrucomicrobia bacterium]|jgi:cytidine deaminase|nr:cytidine deaminase [Verrucomicrobiota bacterium]
MDATDRTRLSEKEQEGCAAAETALARCHAPYSRLRVAAALVLEEGEPIAGTNYECASYGLSLCAERSAISRAQSEGTVEQVTALVLVARADPGGPSLAAPLTPCGACRQWIAELSARIGQDFPVYSFLSRERQGLRTTARQLLPDAFTLPSPPS